MIVIVIEMLIVLMLIVLMLMCRDDILLVYDDVFL